MNSNIIPRVRIDTLEIDPYYHRPLNLSWLNRIIENFNPDLMNAPRISFRDNHHYILDGLHTVKAFQAVTRAVFIDNCIKYSKLTQAQEKLMYYTLNSSRKSLSVSDRLLVKPLPRELVEGTQRAGFILDPLQEAPWCIRAVQKARECFDRLGAKRYEKMLKIIGKTWNGKRWSVYERMLAAMTKLFSISPVIGHDRFVRLLSTVDLWDLDFWCLNHTHLCSSATARLALAIGYIYNDGEKRIDLLKLIQEG